MRHRLFAEPRQVLAGGYPRSVVLDHEQADAATELAEPAQAVERLASTVMPACFLCASRMRGWSTSIWPSNSRFGPGELLRGVDGGIVLSEHLDGQREAMFRHACRMGAVRKSGWKLKAVQDRRPTTAGRREQTAAC